MLSSKNPDSMIVMSQKITNLSRKRKRATNCDTTEVTGASNATTGGRPDAALGRCKICPKAVLARLSAWRQDERLVLYSQNVPPLHGGSADIKKAIFFDRDVQRPFNSVAVKCFRLGQVEGTKSRMAGFVNEIEILSELKHHCIVELLGFVEDTDRAVAWILLPWEDNGNLRDFVQSQDLVIPERLSLIYDIACGIEYLHSRDPPICHADLKSLNILVNSECHAIITDFGSARKVQAERGGDRATGRKRRKLTQRASDAMQELFQLRECGTFITLTGPIYTLRWAAPEVLQDENITLASDVWAFGWICWEVMTGNIPFDDLRGDAAVILKVTRGDLPLLTSNEHISQVRALCVMMGRCWSMDPQKRPTAKECERNTNWMGRVCPSGKGATKAASANHLCALGYMNNANGNTKEAGKYFLMALKRARETDNKLLVAAATLGLGSIKTTLQEYYDAELRCKEALEIFQRINFQAGIANTQWGLGELYRLQGRYQEANTAYREALRIYNFLNDLPGIANAKLGLGDILRLREDYHLAKSVYLQAQDTYKMLEDEPGVANAVWALAEVYRLTERLVDAESSYREAKAIYTSIGDQSGIANTTWGLAEVYRVQFKFGLAESSYARALRVFESLEDSKGVVDCYWGLGEVYKQLNEHSKAEESFQSCVSKSVPGTWTLVMARNSLHELRLRLG